MIRRLTILIALLVSIFSAQATGRALLVGIGNYDTMTTGWGRIHGDDDVALLRPMLERRGFSDIVTLTDRRAKKADIVGALKSLASRCKPGDKVYFHFSGHGQPIKDLNQDEGAGKEFDESIIPYDACRDSRRLNGTYNGQNHLIDDELNPLLNAIKVKLGDEGELFVAVDACYSRGIQKDEYSDIDPELIKYVRGTDHAFFPKGRPLGLVKMNKPGQFSPGAKMTVVTACRENERNFEYKAPDGKLYGSLTYYIYTLLKSGADFYVWSQSFSTQAYRARNIFQTSQHPTIESFR